MSDPWTVRPATEADLAAVTEIRIRSWRAGYAGLLPAAALDGLDAEADLRRRREFFRSGPAGIVTLVATDPAGAVAGFCITGPYRDDERDLADAALSGSVGEVYALYTDPPRWGCGAGRVLLEAAVEWLASRGLRPVRLWVLAGNERARRFYESAGFAADGRVADFEIAGEHSPEVRYTLVGPPL
jgi:GNAT superfamily N-acetyltransferase